MKELIKYFFLGLLTIIAILLFFGLCWHIAWMVDNPYHIISIITGSIFTILLITCIGAAVHFIFKKN